MTAATFGDLVGTARGHLDDAAGLASTAALHSGSVIAAARVTGGLALTLSHYLDDIAPYSVAEAITSSHLNAPLRAAVDARVALQMTAESLRAAEKDHGVPSSEPPDPLTAHLAAAATSLAAGRDLLRTHFSTDPDGWPQRLDWAAVITSVPVTRALLAEVASWSRQLAFMTGWLSLASAPDPALPDPARQGLAGAYHWLLTGCAAITAGQRDDPATAADTELMRAIPVSLPPRTAATPGPRDRRRACRGSRHQRCAAAHHRPGRAGGGRLVHGDDGRIVALDSNRRSGGLPHQRAHAQVTR